MYFLAKNSYGENWGDKGLFRIAYGAADVGHPEDTFVLTDCFTTSTKPATVAAWSDPWPVLADDSEDNCVLYTANERDTISGIAEHFRVDILQFIESNTYRGVINTTMLGDPPRPEPQLQAETTWSGSVFQICDIRPDIYSRVASDPCTRANPVCNGNGQCRAGRCDCLPQYSGSFCEQRRLDDTLQRSFTLSNGQQYTLFLEPQVSWSAAQRHCEAINMRLARLYSPLHASEVYKQMGLFSKGYKVWIGLNDEQFEGRFVWVGGNVSAPGTPLDFSLWGGMAAGNQPDNREGNEDCVELLPFIITPHSPDNVASSREYGINHDWNDRQCSDERMFLCSSVDESSDACVRYPCSTAGPGRPRCVTGSSSSTSGRECLCDDAGQTYVSDEVGCSPPLVFTTVEFQLLGGVPHVLYFDRATWTEADRICREAGMGLVKLTSDEHADQVHGIVLKQLAGKGFLSGEDSWYWIGLNDRAKEGRFAWASDGPGALPASLMRWVVYQPDDLGGRQDCVIVWRSGEWDDDYCWRKAPFVCSSLQ